MAQFFLKLTSPHPTFARDMPEDEGALMQQPLEYWGALMQQWRVVVFGPVMDRAGPYGLGIAEFADEAAAGEFAANAPVVRANRGFSYAIHPMQAVTRDRNAQS
jgi:uncharacterized protein YciI